MTPGGPAATELPPDAGRTPRRGGRVLAEAARLYRIPWGWLLAIDVLGPALIPLFGALLSFRETHRVTYLIRLENGPVELTTFALFMAAGALGIGLALRVRRRAPTGVFRTFLVLGLFALFLGMEEISWGQSFFNYRTPFGLGRVNEQGEFNLHNMPGLMDINDMFLLAFGLASLAGIAIGRRPSLRAIAIPRVLLPYAVTITFMGGVLVLIYYVIVHELFDLIVGYLAEIVELLVAATLFLYFWLKRRGPDPAAAERFAGPP